MSKSELNLEKKYVELRKSVKNRYVYEIGKTLHNHSFDVVKSSFQKCIRRSLTDLCMYFVLDSVLFDIEDEGADSFLTNVVNRLHIIISEDIGLANNFLHLKVASLFEKWDKNKNKGPLKSRLTFDAITDLVNICKILCESKHSRRVDEVAVLHLLSPKEFLQTCPSLYEGFEQTGTCPFANFSKALDEKHPACMRWLRYMIENKLSDIKLTGDRKSLKYTYAIFPRKNLSSELLIWNDLLRRAKSKEDSKYFELVKYLMELFFSIKSGGSLLFITHAVLCFMKQDGSEKDCENNPDLFEKQDVLKILENHIKAEISEVPDFCLDNHTSLGRKKGRYGTTGTKFFLEHGCFLENVGETGLCEKIELDVFELYKQGLLYEKM